MHWLSIIVKQKFTIHRSQRERDLLLGFDGELYCIGFSSVRPKVIIVSDNECMVARFEFKVLTVLWNCAAIAG